VTSATLGGSVNEAGVGSTSGISAAIVGSSDIIREVFESTFGFTSECTWTVMFSAEGTLQKK